ncbi:MAG: tol-pal system YbgF family protein [Terriglobales bacterium]
MRLLVVALISLCAFAQQSGSPPRSAPPPWSGESSSKDTKVDLSPPPGESGLPAVSGSDTHELRPWDPHKADKNVEIGDFYFKRRNYGAAVSRYREALYWQDNHAIATLHLAQALEKMGNFSEARKSYESYLKILPHGPDAADARKALERLKDKPDTPASAQSAPPK